MGVVVQDLLFPPEKGTVPYVLLHLKRFYIKDFHLFK